MAALERVGLLLTARAGLGLLRNFPRKGQTALLSPWGGNGTGHTSHGKLTSKERVREERWLVPFLGLAFRAAPVSGAVYISIHGSGGGGSLHDLAREAQDHMVRSDVARIQIPNPGLF